MRKLKEASASLSDLIRLGFIYIIWGIKTELIYDKIWQKNAKKIKKISKITIKTI